LRGGRSGILAGNSQPETPQQVFFSHGSVVFWLYRASTAGPAASTRHRQQPRLGADDLAAAPGGDGLDEPAGISRMFPNDVVFGEETAVGMDQQGAAFVAARIPLVPRQGFTS
jgi:hypothetical protein